MYNRKKRIFTIFIAIIILCAVIIFFTVNSVSVVEKTCSSEITAKINDIINLSNNVLLAMDKFYDDFFTIKYDNDGIITAIVANTGLINQITLIWSTEIQNRLNELRKVSLKMTAGRLTGSALLSQFGAEIEINAQVTSSCYIKYKSQFIHSGINQTLHRLVLYTDVNAEVTVPLSAGDVTVSQEIIIAETLLAGKVPDSYLIGESSTDYLDLLP